MVVWKEKNVCKYCHTIYISSPYGQYCSTQCYKRQADAKNIKIYHCKICNDLIPPKNKNQIFCSDICEKSTIMDSRMAAILNIKIMNGDTKSLFIFLYTSHLTKKTSDLIWHSIKMKYTIYEKIKQLNFKLKK